MMEECAPVMLEITEKILQRSVRDVGNWRSGSLAQMINVWKLKKRSWSVASMMLEIEDSILAKHQGWKNIEDLKDA